MNTQSVWVEHCRDAIQELRVAVKQAKLYRAACCQAFAAALAAQLASEHFVHSGSLSTSLAQQQQRLCASMTAAIELAQRRIQVNSASAIVCNMRMAMQCCQDEDRVHMPCNVLSPKHLHRDEVQVALSSSRLKYGLLCRKLLYNKQSQDHVLHQVIDLSLLQVPGSKLLGPLT